MAIIKVPISSEADANQFISIMAAHGFTNLPKLDESLHTVVGQDACVWSKHKEYIHKRTESVAEWACLTLTPNQLATHLQELR